MGDRRRATRGCLERLDAENPDDFPRCPLCRVVFAPVPDIPDHAVRGVLINTLDTPDALELREWEADNQQAGDAPSQLFFLYSSIFFSLGASPPPIVEFAVAIIGPEYNLAVAYIDVVARKLGFNWRFVGTLPDADVDRLCMIMQRINATLTTRGLPPPPQYRNALDSVRGVSVLTPTDTPRPHHPVHRRPFCQNRRGAAPPGVRRGADRLGRLP